MRVKFHPEATKEMFAAARFYERRGMGLGDDFLREVELALNLIREFPDAFSSESTQQARKYRMTDFPFTVSYLIEPDTIFIVAVAHQRRKPDYWKSRLKGS